MSVFAKDRHETSLQFYANALDLQRDITILAMKEKFIPKKWRYAVGYPLISKVDELVDNITYANSLYPVITKPEKSESKEEYELAVKAAYETLARRKHYQTLAIANCFQIQNKIKRMVACKLIKIEQTGKIIDYIAHEIELLKAWKKSSKIYKQ